MPEETASAEEQDACRPQNGGGDEACKGQAFIINVSAMEGIRTNLIIIIIIITIVAVVAAVVVIVIVIIVSASSPSSLRPVALRVAGKFYRFKTPNHPHTNMAKAALNMMTRTHARTPCWAQSYHPNMVAGFRVSSIATSSQFGF